jgi:hypothetical protein
MLYKTYVLEHLVFVFNAIRMGTLPLILGILVVLGIVYYWRFFYLAEGFETIEDKVKNRNNPLAQGQNPLTNPAMPIGIAEALAAKLTNINEVALNVPKLMANGAGSYTQVAASDPISPRVDNENSFLGLIQMCKAKGTGNTPFSDPAFAANCGMCLTSGVLKTGETFSNPTGVLVYSEDKAAAIAEKKSNGYSFPRIIPSLGAAVCQGSTRADDSQPVLAITQSDFDGFRKRKNCRDSHGLGNECAQCVSTKETSWIPKSGGTESITLWLWGAGSVVVTLGGQVVSVGEKPTILANDKGLQVPLGKAQEGTTLSIKVIKGTSTDGPYVYGAIVSKTPSNTMYKLPIDRFLEKDSISGSYPRRGAPQYFSEIKAACVKLLPQANKSEMAVDGFLPLTFVESDQLAAFDCATSPFVSTQESAEILIDDPCLNPRGQGPNNYTDECMRQTILAAGCSTNGRWYKFLPEANERNFALPFYTMVLKWVNEIFGETVPDVSMGCRGIDISSPCDEFLGGGVPDKTCMSYLYTNESEGNKRIGRTYNAAPVTLTSMFKKEIQFCQNGGSLNPQNPNGLATLQEKARSGYKGYSGIEAVRRFLSDVFTKATSNLDANVSDDNGGRKDSWAQCIGTPIADPPLNYVKVNGKNDVITLQPQCIPLPSSLDLYNAQNRKIGEVNVTGNYILSFNITPRGIHFSSWTNIIHFNMKNSGSDWSRAPAIWFWPASLRLHVRIGDLGAGGWNWGIDTNLLPINQKSSFRLECIDKKVTLTVNGDVWNETQPASRAKGLANIYAGSPWYPSANALIENLCYTIL